MGGDLCCWLSRKRKAVPASDAEQVVQGALLAVSQLGDLMQRYPTAILDLSALPLPKPKMKDAIKIA